MTERTILVCVNVDCQERGSEAVLADFQARQDAGELADVDVREYICFSACEKGPNVVCVEDQVWYCGVQPDDVDDIVKAFTDGTVVGRLTEHTDRVTRNLIFTVLDAGLLPGDIRWAGPPRRPDGERGMSRSGSIHGRRCPPNATCRARSRASAGP